ncbi:hypothetical protein DFR29_114167 [Tahibacter aquaticus]|uniref:Secreted protein n=2 Tax=Tahibacter aquaticus TaxID=520092 RepID=A0A4R6YQE4_9GAMM|nr:hypothetical protein DFR29_114167 [Tahibacter aquaticus]
MTRMAIRALAVATLAVSSVAGAVLSGPVNTPCSATTTAGTVVNGTQGWSINPATGNGYWSCCGPGTACVGRDKPQRLNIRNTEALAPDATTAAPTRAQQLRSEQAPARPERQADGQRGRGY